MFEANIGGIDRALRAIVGFGAIIWAMLGGPIWAFVGVVPLATAILSFCPAYKLVGLNTCPLEKE